MIKQNDPKRRGKASRDKGKRSELELARLIRETWGYEVRRGHVWDHEPDIVGLDGIHIEVKRVEHLNLNKAMEQAREESVKKDHGLPTVFHRTDRTGWLVTMNLADWIDLYGAWRDEQ